MEEGRRGSGGGGEGGMDLVQGWTTRVKESVVESASGSRLALIPSKQKAGLDVLTRKTAGNCGPGRRSVRTG